MKKRFYPLRFSAIVSGALALVATPFLIAPARAQVRPTHRPDMPAFDSRAPAAAKSERTAERKRGQSHLTAQLPSAVVDFDPLLDAPIFVRASDGFLTGPNGQGRGVSALTAQALSAADPLLPIKAFLNEHRELFGHGAEALDGARVKRDYVDKHNGLHTVVWEQQLDGIPLFQSALMGHITQQGELASLCSSFVPDLAASADAGTPGRAVVQSAPPITAAQAVALAARNLGMSLTDAEIVAAGGPVGEGSYMLFKTPEEAYARLVWLPLHRSGLRLGWDVMVTSHTTKERFRLVIDAQTGEPCLRQNLTCYLSDATYNVYTKESPSPFSPGLQFPGTAQPPLTNRFRVVTPALDTTASPAGWIADSDNTTTGNNADAFADRNFDGQPDQPRPVGNPNRVFDFSLDLTQDPKTYLDAATVQMFYWLNWYHDRVYQLGFTEAAGNYQQDNFGRGGLGSDNIICYVQAGADAGMANNAFFSPAPDGIHGEIAMFIWDGPSPARDGDLDADVILHEATHGTSERLVGGGVLISALQTSGMGEGWSDFYALSLNSDPSDDPDAAYPPAGYAGYQLFGLTENYYFGLRHFPYCTDLTKNPFTFKDIDPGQIIPHTGVPRSPIYPFSTQEADEVHHQGEVWCVTLWGVRANMIHNYGYAGNQMMLQLATDGMKVGPANPTFLQARDAILLADRIDNAGANTLAIWSAFAKRGMGFSARSPASSTTAGVFEAFDLPGLFVDHVVVSGGNGNGVVDNNECNDLQIFLGNNAGFQITGVSGRLSCSTPGVIVVQPLATYPIIPDGATNANLTPFRISTSPAFVCGTPLDCTLVVKADQTVATNQFRLSTGEPGTPLRFDNSLPVAIPDAGEIYSVMVVSNVNSALSKVTAALYITHTYDSDLLIQLISPDGTTNTLSANNGGYGQDYGASCSPDSLRTTFDDDAFQSISTGSPPFVGSFQPQTPLSVFIGKAGPSINGDWRLRVVDQYAMDVGTLQCWSLFLSPSQCKDGGGECPGADLALGMTALPDPVVVGNNLTYSITVINSGPSSAKNVTVTHLLPSSVIFVSAVSSQGTCSQAGGLVTGNLGTLSPGAGATVTVVGMASTVGTVSSTASVSSSQSDPDTSNNSATVFSHVNPVSADLVVGIVAAPNSIVLGGTLTYTVTVTNNGPSGGSGVLVGNALPANVVVLSATVTQGSISPGGNLWTVGTLPVGAGAMATITVVPTQEGSLTATSTAQGNQLDPVPANNTATTTTVVGPAADLAISITDFPDPAVVSSNVTYIVAVTNRGPSAATSVTVNDFLPANVPVLSTNASQGTAAILDSTLTWNVGTLASGAKATLTIVVSTTTNGVLTTSATVAGAQTDPNPANNNASATTVVALPGVSITAAGATLTAESFSPPNGAIDIGETVTIILRLRNSSNVSTLNLVGTLLTNSGVAPLPPNNPQTYGVLAPSGFPVGRSFTFSANGTNGQTISPTLQLRDGATTYPPVTFNFTLPNTRTYTNTNAIVIRDNTNALAYPSTILVSGFSGTVGKVTATISNLTHTFAPDVDVLLVAPGGQDSMLMSGAGGNAGVVNATLTFDDAAPSPLSDNSPLYSGSYQPANYAGPNLPGPAPAGPYPAAMSMFNGANPNGTWSLFVADHAAGDTGSIAGGWSLVFTTITPVNQLADLGLSAADAPDPVLVGAPLTYTFTVANSGPNAASSVAFTNTVPAGVTLVSASPSQGIAITNANTVLANLGTLNTGAVVTVTIVVIPTLSTLPPGINTVRLTNTASVGCSETDPNPANNLATAVTTVVRLVADVGVSQTAAPDPVAVGNNLTNTIVVTNLGPSTALGVVLTDPLPAGAAFVSASSTVGTCSNSGGTVTCSLGDLAPNASATIALILKPSLVGRMTNTASVASYSQDTNSANNTATYVATVTAPVATIISVGAVLTHESGPVNALIDPGETVTVSLALANIGSLDTVNLKATLQASGGVTSPSGPQNYGPLVHGGPATEQSFAFTAASVSGGAVVATLQLQDERPGVTNSLGTVAFVFNPPSTSVWSNTSPLTIPDHGIATPYPSTIAVSNLLGVVTKATVTLNRLTHSFPHDVSALLVSPAGANVLLMSHAGGGHSLTNPITLTFDDAVTNALPNSDQLASGTNRPSTYPGTVAFPTPAPAGSYGSILAAVAGRDPNGTWSLYVLDDAVGDAGYIAGGWSLGLATASPLSPLADLAVGMTSTPGSLFVSSPLTNTIWVTNLGPASATGVVVTNKLSSGQQVITNIGSLTTGATFKVTIVIAPAVAGTITSTASIGANEVDLNPANNSAQTTTAVVQPASAVLTGSIVNRQIRLSVTAQPGFVYAIQVSTNLVSWVSLSTNTASSSGTIKFTDTTSSSFRQRFYRTKRLSP